MTQAKAPASQSPYFPHARLPNASHPIASARNACELAERLAAEPHLAARLRV
ncbi:MAG: hypothetical protein ACFB9N_04120 [Geitlerinemataceae cyanobacterium]